MTRLVGRAESISHHLQQEYAKLYEAILKKDENMTMAVISHLNAYEVSSLLSMSGEHGSNLLQVAMNSGHAEIVSFFAELMDKNDLKKALLTGGFYLPVIHSTAIRYSGLTLKLLRRLDRDCLAEILTLKSKSGDTPIHLSIYNPDVTFIVKLLNMLDEDSQLNVISHRNKLGYTPIDLYYKYFDIVIKTDLRYGVNLSHLKTFKNFVKLNAPVIKKALVSQYYQAVDSVEE